MNFKIADNGQPNEVLEIGHLAEIATDASIIIGGEHFNDKIINITMTGTLEGNFANHGNKNSIMGYTKHNSKTIIGNAVVISKGVTILSGVQIGNCAVIGANALVTKDIPDYAIAVGNPAKVIGYRIPEEKIEYSNKIHWWDLKSNILTNNFDKINQLKNISFVQEDYYSEEDNKNYIVMSQPSANTATNSQIKIIGIEINGKYTPLQDCPDILKFFVLQLGTPMDQPVYLIKNLFELMTVTT